MHKLKSQTNLPPKDKESTSLSQDIASSWVSTEVYYTVPSDDKQIKSESETMGALLEKQGI